MSAEIIDGKQLSQQVREQVAKGVQTLHRPPGLATVLVGDDEASAVYVASKRRRCAEAGIADHHRHESGDITQEDLEKVVDDLNADPAVDGILVQLPLPSHLDSARIIARIDPDKDVDGLTEVSAGRLILNRPGLRPCTPEGVMQLLDWTGTRIEGTHAVVVGRSELVGRPLAQMLLARNATVTICHSRTHDLATFTRQADILVAAVGIRALIGRDHVKPGAAVVDVGIHRTDDGLEGDVDFDAVREVAGHLTPVPGGVGPMTIASLLRNTVIAAGRRIDARSGGL